MSDFYETTVGECIRARAAAFPDRVAVEMIGEGRETYSECFQASLALARGLVAAGIRQGDTVVIMAPNCLTAIHSWLGANLAGATEVTINTAYRARLLEHAVNISGARLVIAESSFLPVLRECESGLTALDHILYFDTPDSTASEAPPAFERIRLSRLNDVLATAPEVDLPAARMSDVASVIYTSGTTGPAKGIMMPHAQVCALAKQSIDGLRLGENDIFYCFHPLFHMAGKFMAVFAMLMAGGRIVLDRTFKGELWVDRVRSCGATVGLAHGPMIEMIYAQPERPEDHQHSVKRLLAAPFPKAIAERFEARFNLRGIEVWGMTEINIGTWRPYDEPLRPGSCGRASDEWVELQNRGFRYRCRVADRSGWRAGNPAEETICFYAWLYRNAGEDCRSLAESLVSYRRHRLSGRRRVLLFCRSTRRPDSTPRGEYIELRHRGCGGSPSCDRRSGSRWRCVGV
ncbi:MAG: AMP-binding protein [Afipia sp.]|nr:AMP-binding protein [Afipia sp.]